MPNPSAQPQGRGRVESRSYEPRDAHAGWIFGIVGFLLVSGLIMHFSLSGVLGWLRRSAPPADRWSGAHHPERAMNAPPPPRLQISPSRDLKELRDAEEGILHSYGWVNKTSGVVRVPIDRAMDMVLARGLPARTGTNQMKLGPSSFDLQQQRPHYTQPEIPGEK